MTNYQYETSPRKIKPEYDDKPKRKVKQKKKILPKAKNKPKTKAKNKNKTQKFEQFMFRMKILSLVLVAFAMLFIVIYRNSLINESFAKIQKLKAQITNIEKENDQLQIAIQNSTNSSNIEKYAKEVLGMQKLSNKQTIYITLPKKDYVEPKAEEVIIEDNTNIFLKIINKIKDIF